MPDDQKSTPATFFSNDNDDSGLPTFDSNSSTTDTSTSVTDSPNHNSTTPDIEKQMELDEPIYAREHAPRPNGHDLPVPDFSTMDKKETIESSDNTSTQAPSQSQEESSPPTPEPSINESWRESMENREPKIEEPKPAAIAASPIADQKTTIPLYDRPKLTDPTPEPVRTPATLQTHDASRSLSFATILLGIIALIAVAAGSFFYLQNRTLKQQISVLQSTQAGRQVPEITPTPTVEVSTQSAVPTVSPSATFSAHTNLPSIISIARQESPTAQLLMITSDDIAKPSDSVYRYWFRRGAGQQQYFYVQQGRTGEPQLFTQATVSPDNNIPDLIPLYEANQIGIDDQTAHTIAWTQMSGSLNNATPRSVSAKFIRSRPSNSQITDNINLWQLTYSFTGRPNIIIQIDATTSQVVYSTL